MDVKHAIAPRCCAYLCLELQAPLNLYVTFNENGFVTAPIFGRPATKIAIESN
jgi:hypothetical protein